MLALGIDPGIATTGYGLVRLLEDSSLQPVTFGVIVTPPDMPVPTPELEEELTEVRALIAKNAGMLPLRAWRTYSTSRQGVTVRKATMTSVVAGLALVLTCEDISL